MMTPKLWTEVVINKAAQIRDDRSPVAITDVRFANEVEAIHRDGGVVIRIMRPDDPDQPEELPSAPGIADLPADIDLSNKHPNDMVGQAINQLLGLRSVHVSP